MTRKFDFFKLLLEVAFIKKGIFTDTINLTVSKSVVDRFPETPDSDSVLNRIAAFLLVEVLWLTLQNFEGNLLQQNQRDVTRASDVSLMKPKDKLNLFWSMNWIRKVEDICHGEAEL